jgi:hypothetical protein
MNLEAAKIIGGTVPHGCLIDQLRSNYDGGMTPGMSKDCEQLAQGRLAAGKSAEERPAWTVASRLGAGWDHVLAGLAMAG